MEIQQVKHYTKKEARSNSASMDMQIANSGGAENWARVGQSVSAALDKVSRAAMQVQKIEDQTALTKLQSEAGTIYANAFDAISNERDYSKHKGIYEEANKSVAAMKGSNGRVDRAFSNYQLSRKESDTHSLNRITTSRRNSNINEDNQSIYNNAINLRSATPVADAKSAIENLLVAGLIGQEKASELEQKAIHDIGWHKAQGEITNNSETLLAKLSDPDWQKDYPYFSEDDRGRLMRAAKTQVAYNQREQEQVLEQQREIDRDMIFDAMNDKLQNEDGSSRLLTFEDIESTSLGEKEKQSLAAALENHYRGKETAKTLGFRESDPLVYAEISKRVRIKGDVTKTQLADYVGKGLSTADFEKLATEVDATKGKKPKKDPAIERRMAAGVDYITSFLTKSPFLEEKIEESKFAHRQIYNKRIEQWEQFWEINPDPTPEQEQKMIDLLTTDIWSENRNNSMNDDDIANYDNSNRLIAAEFEKFASTRTRKDVVDLYGDGESFTGGQKMKKDGIIYTYNAQSKLWEFEE